MPIIYANIFQPLIDVFESVLKFFHDSVGMGWGLSIVALTVVVRIVLLPLTLKQFRSMQGLQRLAPEMKALQEKYKDDRQRLSQEMMKFYSDNKVNPLGSCLPMLPQIPVFLSLFYMLRKDLRHDICPTINPPHVDNPRPCGETDASQFLFIPAITNKATGAVLVALIVLYVGSQLLSSLLMSVTADRNQRIILIGLPFLFTVFIISFPSGLIVYWITTNFWTILQQYIVRRTVGPLKPPPGAPATPAPTPLPAAAAAAGGGGPPPPPPRKKKKRSGRRR